MKLETLVERYKNLGYEPKNLDRDLEVFSIMKWLYDKHDISFTIWYNNTEKTTKKVNKNDGE